MLTSTQSPYISKPKKSFWRTGMANINLGDELFQSIHDLQLNTDKLNIASVGSCFAQHVGRWLVSNGYPFSQSKLDTKRESSFAFGNIYTPKCFLQWLNYDSQAHHLFNIYYNEDTHRYHDLLRPTVNEDGFLSKNALIEEREQAKSELYNTIKSCNILIFTLGLTEAWKDSDNFFYPSCPGVISGEFDEKIYSFHEFHYKELLSDIIEIKNLLKEINPTLKIILTVSPVPLTATATNKHILVANQYSKSTLRSVAGYLSHTEECFQYFPSYEIITVNNKNDFRFESNQRTVSTNGVNYVMKHFHTSFTNMNKSTTQNIAVNVHEVVCEEEQLAAAQKLKSAEKKTHAELLTLIGDSHMGKLSSALTRLGIPHSGGMIMNGSGFAKKKFFSCEEEYFVPLENAQSRKLWASALDNLLSHQNKNQTNSIVISNIGIQTHQTISRLIRFLKNKNIVDFNTVSHQQFVDFYQYDQIEQLTILLNIKKSGHNVIVISDTPFCQYFEESKEMYGLVSAYHEALTIILANFDIPFINAAKIFDNEINDPINYASTLIYSDGQHDWIHGGDNYYIWLAEKLIIDVILPVMSP